MKKAIQKVQFLKNVTKIIEKGDMQVIAKKIAAALASGDPNDLAYADKHFQKLLPLFPMIRKYHRSEETYHNFLRELRIETYGKKDVIFELGEIGRKMFFILEGTLLVYNYFAAEITTQTPTKEIHEGEHFGEVSLHHRIPRTATIVCKTDVTLAVLNYEAYHRYLHQFIDNLMHDKYRVLKPASLFYNWSQLTLSLILHHLKELQFQRGHYVYRELELDQNLYIVKSGEVCIQKVCRVGGKRLESGLVYLTAGQCFGDYEYVSNQSWYKHRENLQTMLRETSAKVTTASEIFVIPLLSYLHICEEYHPSVLKVYLKQVNPIIVERMEKLRQHQKQKQEEEPLKSPFQSLLQTIRQAKVNEVRETKPRLEPLLLKFDRNHKILLMKTLRDKCNIPQPVPVHTYNISRNSSRVSRLKRYRSQLNLDEHPPGGFFIKSYVHSQITSPNTSQEAGRPNRAQSFSKVQMLLKESVPRSSSQQGSRKFKFELRVSPA